ncbi:helix-turn-helix domain-containing protein [Streptomyces sp. INA 01156]
MVDRVAAILEAVARSDGLSLTEIARRLDAPVSSVQGLVNGLVATGYLDERGRVYQLGVAPYFINLLAGRPAVHRVGHDDLLALHAETGNTAVVAVAVGADVVDLDHCSTEPRTAYLAERFIRRQLIRTSTGWLLLADWEQRDLWAYLETLGSEDSDRVERFLGAMGEIRSGACSFCPARRRTPTSTASPYRCVSVGASLPRWASSAREAPWCHIRTRSRTRCAGTRRSGTPGGVQAPRRALTGCVRSQR